MAKPDCFKCCYLDITWNQEQPYACRGMGFKSKEIPWRVVVRTSGKPCMVFRPKPASQKT